MSVFEKPPRRTKQVNILMTVEEKKRLDAAAAKKKMTIAEFIRSAVNKYAGSKKIKRKR